MIKKRNPLSYLICVLLPVMLSIFLFSYRKYSVYLLDALTREFLPLLGTDSDSSLLYEFLPLVGGLNLREDDMYELSEQRINDEDGNLIKDNLLSEVDNNEENKKNEVNQGTLNAEDGENIKTGNKDKKRIMKKPPGKVIRKI